VVFGSRCRPRRGSRGRLPWLKEFCWFNMCCSIGAAGFRPSSRAQAGHDAAGALALRRRNTTSATRRAASMQDTLSEGTARAAQLAPSAVTTSAVGGSATRSVVADSLRRRAAPPRRAQAARSRVLLDEPLLQRAAFRLPRRLRRDASRRDAASHRAASPGVRPCLRPAPPCVRT